MRYSRSFIPTLREDPAEARNPSHRLLLRAGYVRQVGAGIYEFLPLGLRVLRKVEAIVREEMNRAGAQEVMMPALLPAELFRETAAGTSSARPSFASRTRSVRTTTSAPRTRR